MTEDEILIRAREAVIAEHPGWEEVGKQMIRDGQSCGDFVAAAARALRDLAKPLSEIAPLDPDLALARRIWADLRVEKHYSDMPIIRGDMDSSDGVRAAFNAIKRGRELERGAS